MQICFATNNKNKIKEISRLLPADFHILSLQDIGCSEELREDQDTLEGNSLQKADYVFKTYQIPCFADDTGLEVFALNGEPGVYSARYAGAHRSGDDNIDLLLKNLSTKEDRGAQFRTVVTLILEGRVEQFEGIVKGIITPTRRGGEGFGYDPIFVPEGETRTFAEMPLIEKNKISHRGIAVNKLIHHLSNLKLN